jgi:hypothetical protein
MIVSETEIPSTITAGPTTSSPTTITSQTSTEIVTSFEAITNQVSSTGTTSIPSAQTSIEQLTMSTGFPTTGEGEK